MRKTLAIFQASPRRLLTLLLITYLIAVAAGNPGRSLSGLSDGYRRFRRHNKDRCIRLKDFEDKNNRTVVPSYEYRKSIVRSCTQGVPFSTDYQFISESSSYFMEIRPHRSARKVSAQAWSGKDPFTMLTMTSYRCPENNQYIVRIKGKTRNKSLCFSRKGILIQKEDPRKSVKCAFYEVEVAGYANTFMLVSAFNPNFVVAFNSKGNRLRGGRYTGRCNYLKKRPQGREKPESWHERSNDELASDSIARSTSGQRQSRENSSKRRISRKHRHQSRENSSEGRIIRKHRHQSRENSSEGRINWGRKHRHPTKKRRRKFQVSYSQRPSRLYHRRRHSKGKLSRNRNGRRRSSRIR